MNRRRFVPIAIAVVIIAVVAGLLLWANRTGSIPAKPPSSAPAAGSCWNLDASTAGRQAPWPGRPVSCDTAHTVEVFYVGQVDHALIVTQRRASGQQKQVNSVVMIGEARGGCTTKAEQFLGDTPRGAQVAVFPDFIKPVTDGFYACAVAQSAGPNNDRFVSRTSSLRGQADALGIACVAAVAAGALSYVACDKPHSSEFAGLYRVNPPNAPFDGTQLAKMVPDGCDGVVRSFLGLPDGAKRDDVTSAFIGPKDANSWIGSDQTYACYAHTRNATSGSLAGLGTRPLTP